MSSIKVLREKARLTQEELAQKLGVGTSTVVKWEKGGSQRTFRGVALICKILKCKAGDLIDEEGGIE